MPQGHFVVGSRNWDGFSDFQEAPISTSLITSVDRVEPAIQDRSSFDAMRDACAADPGAFHGSLAKRQICWFLADEGENGAWAYYDDCEGHWTG